MIKSQAKNSYPLFLFVLMPSNSLMLRFGLFGEIERVIKRDNQRKERRSDGESGKSKERILWLFFLAFGLFYFHGIHPY